MDNLAESRTSIRADWQSYTEVLCAFVSQAVRSNDDAILRKVGNLVGDLLSKQSHRSSELVWAWLWVHAAYSEFLREQKEWQEVLDLGPEILEFTQEPLILDGAQSGDQPLGQPFGQLSVERLLRNLCVARYEVAVTSIETVWDLDTYAAQALRVSRLWPRISANLEWILSLCVIARCDLSYGYGEGGTLVFGSDAPRLLAEADRHMEALSQMGSREDKSPRSSAAWGHIATAARDLHFVLNQPGSPLWDRADHWFHFLEEGLALSEPAVEREWAYAASDRAMQAALFGNQAEVEGLVCRVQDLYEAHPTDALRRALGKALAALSHFAEHEPFALEILAQFASRYEDEEYGRFFGLRIRAAIHTRSANNDWEGARDLVATMLHVCSFRKSALLLRLCTKTSHELYQELTISKNGLQDASFQRLLQLLVQKPGAPCDPP